VLPTKTLSSEVGHAWPEVADLGKRYPMPFSVKAYVDDHPISLKFETAKEAFAKAVEWHVVERFKDVSIDDSAKSYSLAEFSSVIEGEMKAFLFPAHDLPDDTPLEQIRLSTRIRNELEFGGLKTVGEVRAASDVVLLSFQNIGQGSVRHLRETLGPKANQ
jgi:DNA-directed RNA polymerase alpha subunit